ncbi:hypothetical protein DINM_001692 [Dirofilaria immitis]|nr:hypothetical protein [Dirofilaria immitis]
MENLPPPNNVENTYMRRFYLQKHSELEFEMQSLRELKHPEYSNAIQMLEEQFRTELESEEIADQLERERIEEQYEREKEAAERELEERRPNEPTPYSEKHMHAKTRPNIPDTLTDQEIQEDLLLLEEAESKNT